MCAADGPGGWEHPSSQGWGREPGSPLLRHRPLARATLWPLVDGPSSLPPDTVRLGGPRSCPRHPHSFGHARRRRIMLSSGLSVRGGPLYDHAPAPHPQFMAEDNSHHFIIPHGARVAGS